MKASIIFPGERADGIRDSEFTLDLYDYKFGDSDERMEFRNGLQQFFATHFDDKNLYILFSDIECPDCGHLYDEGDVCPNENCISNAPASD